MRKRKGRSTFRSRPKPTAKQLSAAAKREHGVRVMKAKPRGATAKRKQTLPSRGAMAQPRPQAAAQAVRPPPASPLAIVGVGASAGGLQAFTALVQAMPADSNIAIVFVLHMGATHESLLAEILGRRTSMRVTEVKDEPRVEPNHVYVNPPGRAMVIRKGVLSLSPEPRVAQYHAIDHFFVSLAEDQREHAIGVVLSGTASDGTAGLKAIKAAGGLTFAQDATAQQDGMPYSAIHSGGVDFVLSPDAIAREIVHLVGGPAQPGELGNARQKARKSGAADDMRAILALLKRQSGVDFAQYKANTLHRHIRRRMVLGKMHDLADYQLYLEQNPGEVEALYQDILIGVTSFFRDEAAFDVLKSKVLPAIFENRARHDTVRAWVLGCSSGEECYSIAMLLKEYATQIRSSVPLIVYGTDLNEAVIDKARAGRYPKDIEMDLSPERLRRFFVAADAGYRIAKPVRDICVFARQNVLADPPFSRMDLISCRNVLIYMEPALQKKLIPILHFALKPDGFLFLGSSESTGFGDELFKVADAKHRVFRKSAPVPRPAPAISILPPAPKPSVRAADDEPPVPVSESEAETLRAAERVLFRRYVPVGVLVNANYQILQFRGDTGPYLSPAPGPPSYDLLKMAREGLLLPLRAALQGAKKSGAAVRDEKARVSHGGVYRNIALHVVPVTQAGGKALSYWVLFEPRKPGAGSESARQARAGRTQTHFELADRKDQVAMLEQELAATREYLQSIIEQHGAANEELQSANEEVQSSNEELQSINEELETSKEEIESTNEELTTVNEELHTRNEELNRANSDLNNLFGSAQTAIVMVWRDLRIRRFTPLAEKLFNLIPSDIGRPVSDIKMNLQMPDLKTLLVEVIESMATRELDVQDSQGHWYLLRVRPYRSLENAIDGAVIVLVDIDALKQDQQTLARQAMLLEQTYEPIYVCGVDGRIEYWNRGAEQLYGYGRDEVLGRSTRDLLGSPDEQIAILGSALEKAGQWTGELTHRTKDGRELIVDSHQTVIQEGDRTSVLVVNRDITERKRLEAALRNRVEELAAADRQKNEFVAMLAHELRNPLAPLRNAIEILRNPAKSPEDTVRTQDLIDRQITKMSRLVDDLLDAGRITRGQIHLRKERTELKLIVQRAIETTLDAIESRGQQLSVTGRKETLVVEADPVRLEQVFANLLNNASKYTRDRGTIGITIELARDAGDSGRPMAVVRVRDDGVGIEKDMLPRVFELFTQADRSLARTQGGLGIGLSLVKSLVDLHGGRVTAHSDGRDRGSEFTVYIPALDPDKARPADAGKGEHKRRSKGGKEIEALRVLVVDDNPDIVESTSLLLRLQGNDVRSAKTGADALDLSASFRPRVVLLDIGMPDIDGYTLAASLRKQEGGEQLMLVAMTGYGTDDDRARALAAGFDHHLTKPVDPFELQQLLELR